jgi:hypothetical protein
MLFFLKKYKKKVRDNTFYKGIIVGEKLFMLIMFEVNRSS